MSQDAIEPDAEIARYGHAPKPCRAERTDCPKTTHCFSCSRPIREGYRPGFYQERVWTHEIGELPTPGIRSHFV